MKQLLTTAIIGLMMFIACTKAPITGRRQLNMVPENMLVSMANSNYQQFLSQNKPVSGTDATLVKSVGNKIATAVTQVMRKRGEGQRVAGYKWEFNLINDPAANAWAMPGGKVAVYSGILPITQTEAGLATVMGHEVAHAVARHGNERMSQGLLVQMGGMALDVALSQKPEQTRNIFLQSFGIGSQLGMLSYSRTHETEADELGLIFMAAAGYDPNEAIKFWERMSKVQKGPRPPEFLSTHPSDETRVANLKAALPAAMKYYVKK